jgi:hypothetical protein
MREFWLRRVYLTVPAFVILTCLAAAADVSSQTNRRRRTSTPIPAPTATPYTAEPLIISRADEFPDENSRAIPPDPNESKAVGADRANVVTLEELGNRIRNLEAGQNVVVPKTDPDEKQKRLLLNLDILSRAEARSESLRKQVFEMIEKENSIRTRIDSLEYDLRPEMIERQTNMVGSLRPEEIRASKKKSLESERANLQTLLVEVQRTRGTLEISLGRADALVEKLRLKFEKEIDASLEDEPSDRRPEN